MSPTNADALGRVADARRSQASGVVQTVRQSGGTLGVAVIGAVALGLGSDVPGRADAITAGFAVGAVATLAAALLLGSRGRRRATTAA